jgi:predicted aconitase with swiveling domain
MRKSIHIYIPLLVGGLEHDFYDFPYIGNVIIPTDELIFFGGVGIPPTRMKSVSHPICGMTTHKNITIAGKGLCLCNSGILSNR